jgi:hypothetical protein
MVMSRLVRQGPFTTSAAYRQKSHIHPGGSDYPPRPAKGSLTTVPVDGAARADDPMRPIPP